MQLYDSGGGEYVDPPQWQVTSLDWIRGFNITTLSMTVLFCAYVQCRYLIPLKITRVLIVFFYVFSYLTLLGSIAEAIAHLNTPGEIMYDASENNISIAEIADIISNFSCYLLGFLYIETMIHIALSVRTLSGKNTIDEVKKVMTIFSVTMITLVVILTILGSIVMYNNGINHSLMDPLYAFSNLVMTVMYIVTLVFMTKTMNHFNKVDLKSIRRSIYLQFSFLLVSFATRTLYYLIVWIVHDLNVFKLDLTTAHYYIMLS